MVCLLASQYVLQFAGAWRRIRTGQFLTILLCELPLTARHAQKFGLRSYCSNAASADFCTRESWHNDCLRQSNRLTLSSGPSGDIGAGIPFLEFRVTCKRCCDSVESARRKLQLCGNLTAMFCWDMPRASAYVCLCKIFNASDADLFASLSATPVLQTA